MLESGVRHAHFNAFRTLLIQFPQKSLKVKTN